MEVFAVFRNPEADSSSAPAAAQVINRLLSEHYIVIDPVTDARAIVPLRDVIEICDGFDDPEGEDLDEAAAQLQTKIIHPELN